MTDLVKLRELELSDLPLINSWRNDARVVDFLGANFLHIGSIVDNLWFDNYVKTRSTNVRLAIVTTADGTHIGNVQLTGIHQVNRCAEFSIMIGNPAYWSRGYGREATLKMLRHAFLDLNMNRVHLTVLADNERAIRMYISTGFTVEGQLAQAVFKNGYYRDLVAMAALRSDGKLTRPWAHSDAGSVNSATVCETR